MFKKLKIKVATIITVSAILVIMISSLVIMFDSIYNSKSIITKSLDDVLYLDLNGCGATLGTDQRTSIFFYDSKTNKKSIPFSNNYDLKTFEKITDTIIASNKRSGSIKISNIHIFYDSKIELDGSTRYALYDSSDVYQSFNSLEITLLIVNIVSILFFIPIGYLAATLFIRPYEESYRKERELFANASHELKTPISIIKTNLEVVKDNKDKTIHSQAKWLESIDHQATRMNDLVKDMLTIYKIDTLQQEKERFETINLSLLIEENLLEIEPFAYDKGIIVESNIEKDIQIKAIDSSINELLMILLDNAIKYNNPKGYIRVNLKKGNKKVVLSIKNSGTGIKQENLEKIFDRFFKEDSSRNQKNGNSFGLGLSIAKSIALANKATIEAKSDSATYSEIIVTFKK